MPRGSRLAATATIVLAMLFSYVAQGQGFQSPTQLKGTLDAEVWGGAVVAQHDGSTAFNEDIWMGGARLGRMLTAPHGPGWLRGALEWDWGVVPVFVITNLQTAYGFELDPVIGRWNFRRNGRTAPYFEMAGGVVFTNSNVPPGDTSTFNIVPKFGFGWQIFTRPQRSLDVGLYAWHLSNAWTARRNPSVNGLQLTIGYHWFRLHRSRQNGSSGPHQSSGGEKPR
jgi:Lipid A 3-O-deacylase (PagL)